MTRRGRWMLVGLLFALGLTLFVWWQEQTKTQPAVADPKGNPSAHQFLFEGSPSGFFVPPVQSISVLESETALHTGPAESFRVRARLPAGMTLELVNYQNGWFYVRDEEERVGWVHGQFLKFSSPDAQYQIEEGIWRAVARGRGSSSEGSPPRLEVEQVMPGILRLTLDEGKSVDQVLTAAEHNALVLPFDPVDRKMDNSQSREEQGFRIHLPIGAEGIQYVSMNQLGLWIQGNSNTPGFRMIRGHARKLILELSAEVHEAQTLESGEGIMLSIKGWVEPIWSDATHLLLPGVRWLAKTELPMGWQVRRTDKGAEIELPAPRAMLKLSPGRISIEYPSSTLAEKTIVIDPGHGGDDPGSIGGEGVLERDLNLEVARLLASLLRQEGARVVLTRNGEGWVVPAEQLEDIESDLEQISTDLAARSNLSNAVRADLFISIHHDSGEPSFRGVQTYFESRSSLNGELSQLLAQHLQRELADLGKLSDRGTLERRFHVLRSTHAPSALLELGFITNSSDERHLTDPVYQLEEAHALVRGIRSFFDEVGNTSHEPGSN